MLRALGTVARGARRAGLGGVLARARDTADAAFQRAGLPPLAATIDGARVRGYLRHRSFLDEAARPGTTYRELFVRTLKPGMTVIDGGAHVGLYSVLGARGVGPGGRVLAFEPDPYNFRALEANTGGLANVTLSRSALAERRREAAFHRSSGTIGSSLLARDTSIGVETVAVTSIDDELEGREVASLLVKLNVEGAEPLVLEGARRTLDRVADATLFVEAAPDHLGEDAPRIVGQIEELGFEVFRIRLRDQALAQIRPGEPLEKGHLFARRASS